MKKRFVIIISIFVLILFIIFGTNIILKNKKVKEDYNISENANDDKSISFRQEKRASIKSTKNKIIEKDGVELKDIDLVWDEQGLQAKGKIKNNNNKEKNIFYMELKLFDDKKKFIDTLIINVEKNIKPKEEFKFSTSVNGIPKIEKIAKVKINTIKSSIVSEM